MTANYSHGAFKARLGIYRSPMTQRATFEDIEAEINAGQKIFSSSMEWQFSYEQDVRTELLYISVEEELRHAEYESLMDEFDARAGFEQSEFERWIISASTVDWFDSYEQAVHDKTFEEELEESSECFWSVYC